MARTPFKLRSGNTTPFKLMGSSPARQEVEDEVVTEKGDTTVNISDEGEISKARKDLVTTTKTKKGQPVEEIVKPGTPGYDKWLAAVKKDPSIEEKYKPKTVTETKEVPVEETIKPVVRGKKSRYEIAPVSTRGATHHTLNIEGEKVRVKNKDMAKWYETHGYTKHPKTGTYIRQSTTGEGKVYDPNMWESTHGSKMSVKPDFDYSGVDYGNVGDATWKNADERQKYTDYQKELKEAQRQIKYNAANAPVDDENE